MNDRLLWVIGGVVVTSAAVVLVAHRQGCLPNDSYEGAEILGAITKGARGAVPAGWRRPPPIGTDPNYRGPDPDDPMKPSPYAMETSKAVRRRTLPRDRGDRGLVEAIRAIVRGREGRIGYLGENAARFSAFGDRLQVLEDRQFTGDDAAAVAQDLLNANIEYLIVSQRTPRPQVWMQDGAAGLRVRLRDGLPLSHFHPLVFARAHILYRVAPPMEFSQEEGQQMVRWVRARLGGEEPPLLDIERSTASVGRDEHRAIVSLRAHRRPGLLGRRILSASGAGPTIGQAVASAVERLERRWPEARALAIDEYRERFDSDLSQAISEMEIEVEIVDRMCRIIDRYEQRMVWQFEIGLEGMYLDHDDGFAYMSPAIPLWRADQYRERVDGRRRRRRHYSSESRMVVDFLADNHLPPNAWDEMAESPGPFGRYRWDFGRFETHHWLETTTPGEVVELYRGVPLVTVADVTRENAVRALQLGAMWLVNNQLEDGQYRYKYEPLNVDPDERWITGNNIVRHALNPYTLLLVNRVAPDPRLVESAERGIRYTLEHLRRQDQRCYVWHRDVPAPYENAKMGTVAVTILSILALGDTQDLSDEYESVLRCLAEELLYMQDPNGHFRQYDVPEDHGYYGAENTIFPGEMLLALARMYGHTHDERYREAFSRGFDWYRRWWAVNVDNTTRDGIYNEENRMNLMGFVPWNVMAMNEMHRHTNEERYADFAFEIQDWIDRTFFYDADRTPYPDYLGAYFKNHWETPAINSNGYTEGAAAAYALALRTGRDVERRRQILVLGVRFAFQVQYEGYATTFYLPDPATAMGGFRYNLNRTRSRNDYSYHAMSALAQAVEFLRPEDYPAERAIALPRTLADALGEPASAPPAPRQEGDAGPTAADGGAVGADGGPALDGGRP